MSCYYLSVSEDYRDSVDMHVTQPISIVIARREASRLFMLCQRVLTSMTYADGSSPHPSIVTKLYVSIENVVVSKLSARLSLR